MKTTHRYGVHGITLPVTLWDHLKCSYPTTQDSGSRYSFEVEVGSRRGMVENVLA